MCNGTGTSLEMLAAADISGQGGRPQRRLNPRKNGFNAKTRQRFLDGRALSCNVTLAAAHAGVSVNTVYTCRARDPLFDGQWREALERGLERLEAMVVEHGGAGLPLEPADPDRAVVESSAPPPFDFDKAIRALQVHANWRKGLTARVVTVSHQASAADTDAALNKRRARV